MHRPRPTFWIATATVAALALGGGVAAARDGDTSTTRGRTHVEDAAHREDVAGEASTTTTTVVPVLPTAPAAPAVNDDDPATHDVGDDHGDDRDRSGPNRGPGVGNDGSDHDDSGHGGPGPG
jgi:hypothetical protein